VVRASLVARGIDTHVAQSARPVDEGADDFVAPGQGDGEALAGHRAVAVDDAAPVMRHQVRSPISPGFFRPCSVREDAVAD